MIVPDTINKAELPNEELSSGEMASISGPGSGSCRPKSLDVRVAPTQICKDIFGSIYEGICVNVGIYNSHIKDFNRISLVFFSRSPWDLLVEHP